MIAPGDIADITRRYQEGEPSKSIAADFHVTASAVAYHLRKAGVLRRGSPNPRVEKKLRDYGDEMVRRYEKGDSMAVLALSYDVSTFTIRRWLVQNDVRIRSAHRRRPPTARL